MTLGELTALHALPESGVNVKRKEFDDGENDDDDDDDDDDETGERQRRDSQLGTGKTRGMLTSKEKG